MMGKAFPSENYDPHMSHDTAATATLHIATLRNWSKVSIPLYLEGQTASAVTVYVSHKLTDGQEEEQCLQTGYNTEKSIVVLNPVTCPVSHQLGSTR